MASNEEALRGRGECGERPTPLRGAARRPRDGCVAGVHGHHDVAKSDEPRDRVLGRLHIALGNQNDVARVLELNRTKNAFLVPIRLLACFAGDLEDLGRLANALPLRQDERRRRSLNALELILDRVRENQVRGSADGGDLECPKSVRE